MVLPTLPHIQVAHAAANITITPITAYNFVVDSNVLSPSTYAPRAATIGAKFCNTGDVAATNVFINIGQYYQNTNQGDALAPLATPVPAQYPQRSGVAVASTPDKTITAGQATAFNSVHTGLSGTGPYSLTHVGGTAGSGDATRYFASLAAGECTTQYWVLTYPNKSIDGTKSVTGGIKPDDDLYLYYDLWASATGISDSAVRQKATMRNEISAAANKIWPNGTNKVPPQYLTAISAAFGWATLTPGGGSTAYPGETITTQGIWYDLGNVGQGFDNNGDGVPDYNAWMQPIGDPTSFDPGCFRLVRTYGIVIVKLKSGGEYLIPFLNQLYFENIPPNTGAVGLVYYEYAASNGACTASLSPYQEVASGSDNEKFNGDFGYGIPAMSTSAPVIPFDKRVTDSVVGVEGDTTTTAASRTLTYNIYFQNNTSKGSGPTLQYVSIGSPTTGSPFMIEDAIPANNTYVRDSAQLYFNAVLQSASVYTVLYKVGGVWTATQPSIGNESQVQALRWVFNQPVSGAANVPISQAYRATWQATVAASPTANIIVNTAGPKIGGTPLTNGSGQVVTDTTYAFLTGSGTISGFVYEDDGTGGTPAGNNANNGIRNTIVQGGNPADATEAGIDTTGGSATVSLYYKMPDGTYILYPVGGGISNTSNLGAGAGQYRFQNLPAGDYKVIVSPTIVTGTAGHSGWTPTTPQEILISGLTSSGTSPENNFGFNAPLSLSKIRTTVSPVTLGATPQYVTFRLGANNKVNTQIDSCTTPVTYPTGYATAAVQSGSTVANLGNVVNSNLNDFAAFTYGTNADTMTLSSFPIAISDPANITAARIVLDMQASGLLTGPESGFRVVVGGTSYPTANAANVFSTGGIRYYTIDLNAFSSRSTVEFNIMDAVGKPAPWTAAQLDSMQVIIVGKKSGSSNTTLNVHSVSAKFDYTCLKQRSTPVNLSESSITTLPLLDTYDSTQLRFVSATVPPTSVDETTSAGKIYWANIAQSGAPYLGPLTTGTTDTTYFVDVTFRVLTSTGSPFTNTVDVGNPAGTVTTATYSTGLPTNNPDPKQAQVAATGTSTATLFTISGNVWEDLDSSGGTVKNPGTEPGIQNVTVELRLQSDNSLVAQALTDSTGNYTIPGIPNGAYYVTTKTNTLPPAYTWTQTGESDDPTDPVDQNNRILVTIAGANSTGNNFGFNHPVPAPTTNSIGDTIFWDIDGNGQQDWSDPGVAGVTVEVYTTSNVLVASTITDSSGKYLFTGLTAGTYDVRVVTSSGPLAGRTLTSDPDANGLACNGAVTDPTTPDFPDPPTGSTLVCDNHQRVTLSGNNYMGADFGYLPPVAVGDTVYFDANANGQQDAGEPGIAGVTVTITPPVGSPVVLTTDIDGKWAYVGTSAGSYAVTVTQPVGYTQTGDPDLAVGTPCSGACPTPNTSTKTVVSGTPNLTFDFGYTNLPFGGFAVSGTICRDNTTSPDGNCNNGATSGVNTGAGEFAITNRTVYLYYFDGTNNILVGSTTTDASGDYNFIGLATNGGSTNYFVSMSKVSTPTDTMGLTTTTGGGLTVSETSTVAKLTFTIAGADKTNVDFAFAPNVTTDFGDLPLSYNFSGTPVTTTYRTLLATNPTGPRNIINGSCVTGYCLGTAVSSETDARGTTTNAASDTNDDGLSFSTKGTWVNGTNGGSVSVTTSGPVGTSGWLVGWIDFDQDGVFDGNETAINQSINMNVTNQSILFNVPASTFNGFAGKDLYARFRLFQTQPLLPTLSYTSLETGGEVEDYLILNAGVSQVDYGDLPTTYPTLLNDSGPRHYIQTVANPVAAFGTVAATAVNIETDGQPNAQATGDSSDNGITFSPSNWTDAYGKIEVRTVGSFVGTAWMMGWIDFNQNNQFDSNELVIDRSITNTAGTPLDITFDPPNGWYTGTAKNLYARFRIFTSEPATSLKPTAYTGAFTGGEVEDYLITGAGTVPVSLSYFLANRTGNATHFGWSTSLEVSNVGFNLYVQSSTGLQKINDTVILSPVVDSAQRTDYKYVATDLVGDTFYIEDVDIYGKTVLHGPYTLDQAYGERLEPEAVDWQSIRTEHQTKSDQRAAEARNNASNRSAQARAALTSNPNVDPATLGYPTFDIFVNKTGLYRITYEQLLAAGLDLTGVHAKSLTISNRGVHQPIIAEPAGPFGPGSYIEFYGQGLDTLYTNTNVYQLRINPRDAVRPAQDQQPPKKDAVSTFYLETATLNRDRLYGYISPFESPWYDQAMTVTNKPLSWNYDLVVENYLPDAAPATLTVYMYGNTSYPQSNPDHHVIVKLNGQVVSNQTSDGVVAVIVSATLPKGLLKEGVNTLTITLPADTGAPVDLVRFDKATITYPRAYIARGGVINFKSTAAAYQVTNLTSQNVTVLRFEGTSATVVKTDVVRSGSTYTATFRGTGGEATYVVTSDQAKLTPTMAPSRENVDITGGTADFVIISHPDFITGLDPLVQARQAQGHTVRVVNVDDVYAQFSYGIYDPQAIKDYIAYAKANMGTRYVLLVGGDSYDYRNYLNFGTISFIPTLYRQAHELIKFAPVDPLYADINNDNVPDLALGRFPVRTSAELDTLVAKTLTYGNISYRNTAVFAADASFGSQADQFRGLLPTGWLADKAYQDNGGINKARTDLINAINKGVALVSFNGHSSYDRWGQSSMFTFTNVGALSNAGKPTVVIQWGCWNTYYAFPSYNVMAHKFLLSGDRGAAAVMGASSLTYEQSEVNLGLRLMPLITQPDMTLGDAILAAKIDLALTNPEQVDVLLGWTLLGDPTLTVAP